MNITSSSFIWGLWRADNWGFGVMSYFWWRKINLEMEKNNRKSAYFTTWNLIILIKHNTLDMFALKEVTSVQEIIRKTVLKSKTPSSEINRENSTVSCNWILLCIPFDWRSQNKLFYSQFKGKICTSTIFLALQWI